MSHDASPESHEPGDGRDEALRALGAELVAAREAAGLSQAEAARLARIGRATLIRWEKGEQPPSEDLLARVRAVYRGEVVALPRDTHDGDADTVPVSRETLGYLRGKLETTVEWLGSVEKQMAALGTSVHAVGETLQALRHQLDRATNGVSGLLTGDVIPIGDAPPPSPPPAPRPSKAETKQVLDAAGIRSAGSRSTAAGGE